jgi:hypothetical protein
MVFSSKKNKVSFQRLWHNRNAQGPTGAGNKTIVGGGGGGGRIDGTEGFSCCTVKESGTHLLRRESCGKV